MNNYKAYELYPNRFIIENKEVFMN